MTDRTALVVAPHPDDEVLGCGGSIAKLVARDWEVHVAIVTKVGPPLFTEEDLVVGRREAKAAHELLGVARTHFLGLPAAGLDRVPHADLNAALGETFAEVRPSLALLPFGADLHADHQAVFHSAMVAVRPMAPGAPRTCLAYETLSETNWNAPQLTPSFTPSVFVDIGRHLERKLEALRCYATQLRPFPHERSLQAIRALAELRGATAGLPAAEAFVLVRAVR